MSIKTIVNGRISRKMEINKDTEPQNQDQKDQNTTQISPFQQFYQGKISDPIYLRYLQVVYLILFFILAEAIMFYPQQYSIFTEYISNLGDHRTNPSGYPIFNFGIIFFGISLIPLINFSYAKKNARFRFIQKQDEKINALNKMEQIAYQLSLGSCIGLVIAGVFPSNFEFLHLVGAIMLFFGFYISNNLQLYARFQRLKYYSPHQDTQKSFINTKLIMLLFNLIGLTFLFVLLDNIHYISLPMTVQKFSSSTFWEWNFFILCNIMIIYGFFLEYSPSSKSIDPSFTDTEKNSDKRTDSEISDEFGDFSHSFCKQDSPYYFGECSDNPLPML